MSKDYPERSCWHTERLDGRSVVERCLQQQSSDIAPRTVPGFSGRQQPVQHRYKTIEESDGRVCAVCRQEFQHTNCLLRKEENEGDGIREVSFWLSCSGECTDAWIRKYGEALQKFRLEQESLERIRAELFV